MILVDSTSSLLQLVTAGTQVLHVQASWVDLNGITVSPALPPQNLTINSATTTTIVPSPAASNSRNLKELSIVNTSGTSATVTIQHTDGTTLVDKRGPLVIPAGCSYSYEDKRGWYAADINGNEVVDQTAIHGLFIKTVEILNGTTSYTPGATTNMIKARMWGGGGAGGGCPATTGANGGGGSTGGYAELTAAVTPGTAYVCAVGLGGTGVSGAIGNPGGVTTLTIGGVTTTANGGLGGPLGTATNAVLGAASPALSTNGTFNGGGTPGGSSTFGGTVSGQGGSGGSCLVGGGGLGRDVAQGSGVGGTGVGFAAGGGGALTTTAAAQTGGPGLNGVILIDEYS